MSSSHDDTILIWDFLNCNGSDAAGNTSASAGASAIVTPTATNNQSDTRSPSRMYNLYLMIHFLKYMTKVLIIFETHLFTIISTR